MAYIGNEPADRFTSIPTVQQFNGDASTTAFTLNRAVGSDQDLLVSVDGVIQDTAAYAVSNGTTLTFSAAPSQGTANIFVNHLGLTIGSVVHPASSALAATTGAFSGKITADAGIDIDNFNIDGTTIALSSGDMVLDGAADIVIDTGGAELLLKDDGTHYASLQNENSDFRIISIISDKDIIFRGNDGGSFLDALTLDMSAAGKANFNAGATFGGIGGLANIADDLTIFSTTSGHNGLRFHVNGILPTNNAGAIVDNDADLGDSSYRFKDIHATNGTIQTSDLNEKQDIATLTSTEMLVGKRLSALFKTFRWKDSVAKKGDNARTHTGIIAQDVQSAFTAEGLDVDDYALFISSTWTNENEEEQTRLGIRYPELLSFVAVYNEQRFVSIEDRLAALEAK